MWTWFAIAAITLILELFSGVFILLLLSVGAVAAGLASWFGLSVVVQVALLAIIPVLGMFVLKRMGKLHLRNPLASDRDSNLNFDIGKSIYIDHWNEQGRSTVRYRGAQWQVKPSEDYQTLQTGKHTIVAVRGIVLVVELSQ